MKSFKVIALLPILLIVLVGCAKHNQEKNDSIKVGAIIFQTGDAAEYGVWVKNGLELAKDQINKQGGISGKKIEILYEDDNTNPKNAVSAFNKLLNNNQLPVIIAGVTSKSAMALAPIAEKRKVVLFSPCASTPDYTNAGDYVFRNWPSDNEEGKLMADYAFNNLKCKSVAILSMNNDYGLGLKSVFSNEFKRLGGKIVFDDSFPEGTTDFKTMMLKLSDIKFDAIYLPSHANEVGSFLRSMTQNNQKYKILGCVTYESPELIKIAGKSADGIIFTTPAFNPNSNEKMIKEFVLSYEEKFGVKPENFAAHSYDALKIIARAINTGGYSADAIKEALYKINKYPGISGETSFDQNGDVAKSAVIKQIRGNKFVILDVVK